jgi:N12 class adenine-specific DNA methylase/adenine-specific DNA methylase
MPSKAEFYRQMAEQVSTRLVGSWKEWTAFLTTAARLYKYPFHEQMMIYAQRPDATACAEYDLWNEKMGRYVRRGSKGIALVDDSSDRPRLRYVFDISDTGTREHSRTPWLWQLEEQHIRPVSAMLERNYGVAGDDLAQQLTDVAGKLASEYWDEHQKDFRYIVDGSFLEEYDELNIEVHFKSAATVSIAYALMSRCGLDTEQYFQHEDFMPIFDFNTPATVGALGAAVSQMNQQVLRQIGVTIQNYEREQLAERSVTHGEQPDLHEERRLPDSRPEPERTAVEAPGQVRAAAESVPEGTPAPDLQPAAADREAVPAPHRDRRDGEQPSGADDAPAGGVGGRDGGAESPRSDALGGPDEHLQGPGRGDSDGGAYQQLTLNLFLSEAEQIQRIDEAENVQTSSAFSFAQEQPQPETVSHAAETAKPTLRELHERYKPIVLEAVIQDIRYRNACGHSDYENAMIECNAAVRRAILDSHDIELIRLFSDVPEFRQRLHREVADETYPKLHELLRPLSDNDIDRAIQEWNGKIESKHAVVRYMKNHAREKDTAAWLAREFDGGDGKTPFAVRPESPEGTALPWPKVQRRIAQLIKEDRFYTQVEQDNLDDVDPIAIREALAQRGIVDGHVVDPEKLDNAPFVQQVMADAQRIAAEESAGQEHPEPAAEPPAYHAETVAVYPGDKNHLPYDVVVQTLRTNEPEPPAPAAEPEKTLDEVLDEHPVSVQVNGEWQTFPNARAAEEAAYGEYKENLRRTAENFHITDDHLGEGGPKAKFQANIEAIKLLKYLEETTGQATPEQQEVLSRYVGWGGLADAFDPDKESWSKEYAQLKELLTPEEYAAARGSTLNAHYTSPTVIRAIYEAVGRMGFETGNILEPSCGVGNFFGMLPEEMRNSRLYGVELDSISGRIAQQLYPKADIIVAGFETTDRRDFYDLAIGNVPFGQYQVNDKAYNKLGFNIHNYFFAKALDQVRPGGVVAFVTSRYTMDAKDSTVRRYLAQRAELLGAIRLPNNAFRANAGTEVVSDIVFLQKRDRPLDIVPEWTQTGQTEDGFTINRYFLDHPEMVLGRPTAESTQYGKQDYTVNPIEGLELADQLHDAVKYIRGTYQEAELPELGEGEAIDTSIPADPNVKNYSYTVVDGAVYFRENSRMVCPDLNATAEARVKGMVRLRDCVQELIDLQMDAATPDSDIREKQAELNRLYDDFSAKYGLINDRANRLAFADDSSYYLLCALEIVDEDGRLERKADMFTKRTIKPHEAVTSVDTASEALAVSIAEKARVDMEYMEQLTGKTSDELAAELQGVIFRLPGPAPEGERPAYVTADEYLSGNVRRKLRQAQRAAQQDPAFAINVEALTAAQPKDLDASEIEVRLGATWIDKEYIQQFMYETFNTPYYLQRAIQVNYASYTAEWQVTGKSSVSEKDVAAYTTYGTSRANAYRLLEDALNLRDVRIYDTVEDADGRERRVLNARETTLAAQKQQAIRDAFRDWIWRDPERRQTLVRQYNEEMNSTRPREYDGSHITFGGMNPSITLRDHQLGAIAHVLYGGNTLLAHEVGAGKTFEMVAAAMESKRLGLCQKSLFVVPNHLTEQWASEFLRLYPSAKILVTTKKDFETHNRKKFCARIATGDYDAVIIGHSQFERIPISRERQERLLYEQIDEITEGIAEVQASGGERFTVKQLERTRKSLEARLEKLQAEGRKDDVVTFEQLGVDRLFVDEAHNYKNLFLYTKMRNVAGLSTSDAQKSSDMFAKCRYMDEITGSRGVIFATGTPVSNSMTELYTMQRYLQYDRLQELSMTHFDCWASRFGETTTALELAPEGTGYRARTRFSKFFNLPELMNLFKEVADIKTADQLHLPTPEVEYHNIVAQPTEHQKEMVQVLSERASKVHSGSVDPSEDNMLKITGDGRKLGLDQRIINQLLPDEPGTKVNQCVANIMQIWRDGEADKLTQLVFCDISTPQAAPTKKAAKALDNPTLHALEQAVPLDEPEPVFTVYEDIRQKLIAQGMPADQIAFIHEANTEVRKKELFAKVRTGQVRVLLGSTAKMGAGTNVQDRLVALHDLDCPWRPGDLAQRKGRIERQGNQNPLVHVYRYVTEGTFDAYLWQTVENKQKFISQIMTSKSPVRSCDDVDETALSFAEIKALCAGDPRIKERMDLDVEVSKLKLMKADHQSKQYRLEDQLLKYFPEEIEKHKGFIQGFEADLETLAAHPHPEDGFAGMEIRGDTLTDKENAGAALLDACKEVKGSEPVQIGSYRGFTMSVEFSAWKQEYTLLLKGQMTHRASLGTDPRGNLTRIDNALSQMPQRLEAAKAQLDNLYQQQAAAKEEVGKPFPYEDDLRVKSARLVELDTLLNLDGRGRSQPESVIAKSARPSVLDSLKRPVPPRSPEKKPKQHEEVR